jgi:hypothetical protein
MAAAFGERNDLNAFTDIQETDTFRPVKLMSGSGQQIDSELLDINRYLSDRLYRVGM